MRQAGRILASALGFSALGLGGVLFSLVGLPLLRLLPGGKARLHGRTRWVIHRFFHLIVAFLGWAGIFRLRPEALPSRERLDGVLILATHPGYLDVVLLLSLLDQLTCVVKADLWNNVWFGRVVRAAGYIPALDPTQVLAAGTAALGRGEALLLFPEGTRTRPGEPYAFHRGAAHLALQAHARILPILITCEPPLLAKGHRWYELPRVSCDYHLYAVAPLELPWPDFSDLPQAQAAREVTAWLEARFNQEAHASGHLAAGHEALHRPDPRS
jgi:1-acyl-sn-glycerol-3-phosphate acyltransferase